MDRQLRTSLIRLAAAKPELRGELLPLLKESREFANERALQRYLKKHPGADPSKHTVRGKGGPKKDGPKKEAPKSDDGLGALKGLSKADRKKVLERALREHEGKKPLKDVSKQEGFDALKDLTPEEQQKVIQKALKMASEMQAETMHTDEGEHDAAVRTKMKGPALVKRRQRYRQEKTKDRARLKRRRTQKKFQDKRQRAKAQRNPAMHRVVKRAESRGVAGGISLEDLAGELRMIAKQPPRIRMIGIEVLIEKLCGFMAANAGEQPNLQPFATKIMRRLCQSCRECLADMESAG